MAVEFAPDVRVNAIAPGWFATDMTNEAFANPAINQRLTRDIPARRIGTTEDMAGAAVYLASRAGDYVLGSTLIVDGGVTYVR